MLAPHVAHWAVQPPSTGSEVAVIWDAASVHRKATTPPTCSGVANCPEGCFSFSRCTCKRVRLVSPQPVPASRSCRTRTFASSNVRFSSCARASTCLATSGVSTQPGHTALTVTPVPCVACSMPTALVKPTTPCLLATSARAAKRSLHGTAHGAQTQTRAYMGLCSPKRQGRARKTR